MSHSHIHSHTQIAEPQQHKQLASERKLLVKIIKANNLNVTDTATGKLIIERRGEGEDRHTSIDGMRGEDDTHANHRTKGR